MKVIYLTRPNALTEIKSDMFQTTWADVSYDLLESFGVVKPKIPVTAKATFIHLDVK